LTVRLTLSSNIRANSSCFDAMLDGKIDSVIGRFRGGRSGPLSVVARSVSDYVNSPCLGNIRLFAPFTLI
jgi:hypothetical protein